MQEIAHEIRQVVIEAYEALSRVKPEEAAYKPDPENWSKKEILGHLIDSAANNHQRIVRASYGVALDFPPYHQTEWVNCQHYNTLDWQDLLVFWAAYNRHLCSLIERMPPSTLTAQCNLGADEPFPLEFVIRDYLRHLKHHLKDLLS
jgi:hypothetical protein